MDKRHYNFYLKAVATENVDKVSCICKQMLNECLIQSSVAAKSHCSE